MDCKDGDITKILLTFVEDGSNALLNMKTKELVRVERKQLDQ